MSRFSMFSTKCSYFYHSCLFFLDCTYFYHFHIRLSRSQYETTNNAPHVGIQHWSVCMRVSQSTFFKEFVSMKAYCCVASHRLCLSQVALAKDTADWQLARTLCFCVRGETSQTRDTPQNIRPQAILTLSDSRPFGLMCQGPWVTETYHML